MNALAPMARLMGAGDLMVEYDQQYERYGVPQPQLLALQLAQTPLGLTDPVSFGTPRPNISIGSTLNEQDLSVPGNPGWPSPIVTYTVPNPRPLVRGESDTGAIVMEGDATGLNNLAGLGLLNTDSAVYYAGTLANDPARLRRPGGAGRPAGADRHQPQAGVPLGHADRQRRLHRDAEREPRQDRPERQPDRALPGHEHHQQVVRELRRRGERHRQQLRQLGLLHPREPGLQRHRRQLRHGLDRRHLRERPRGPVVAGAVRQPGHHRPHHRGPTAARRPLALGVGRDADLRRQGPDPLRADRGVARDERPDADVPLPHVPHAAGHDRRHDQRQRAAAAAPPPSASPRSRSPASRCTRSSRCRPRCCRHSAARRPPTASPS